MTNQTIKVILFIFFIALTSCDNPISLTNRDFVEDFKISSKSLQKALSNETLETIVNITAKEKEETVQTENIIRNADLLIAIDDSGSMNPHVNSLESNFNSFINNLSDKIDLRIGIVDGKVENNYLYNKECFHYVDGNWFMENTQTGFITSANATINYQKVSDSSPQNYTIDEVLKDFIKRARYRNLSGSIVRDTKNDEQPIKYGSLAYIHLSSGTSNCIRSQSHKFMITVTDEDERKDSSPGGSISIDAATIQTFIDRLNIFGTTLFTITHGESGWDKYPTSNTYKATAAPQIARATGGEDYDLTGDFANHLKNFAGKVNESINTLLIDTGYIIDESIIINKIDENGGNISIPQDQFTISQGETGSRIEFSESHSGNFTFRIKYVTLDQFQFNIGPVLYPDNQLFAYEIFREGTDQLCLQGIHYENVLPIDYNSIRDCIPTINKNTFQIKYTTNTDKKNIHINLENLSNNIDPTTIKVTKNRDEETIPVNFNISDSNILEIINDQPGTRYMIEYLDKDDFKLFIRGRKAVKGILYVYMNNIKLPQDSYSLENKQYPHYVLIKTPLKDGDEIKVIYN